MLQAHWQQPLSNGPNSLSHLQKLCPQCRHHPCFSNVPSDQVHTILNVNVSLFDLLPLPSHPPSWGLACAHFLTVQLESSPQSLPLPPIFSPLYNLLLIIPLPQKLPHTPPLLNLQNSRVPSVCTQCLAGVADFILQRWPSQPLRPHTLLPWTGGVYVPSPWIGVSLQQWWKGHCHGFQIYHKRQYSFFLVLRDTHVWHLLPGCEETQPIWKGHMKMFWTFLAEVPAKSGHQPAKWVSEGALREFQPYIKLPPAFGTSQLRP